MKILVAYQLIKIANDRNQPCLNRENLVTLKIANRVIEKITPSQNDLIYQKITKNLPENISCITAS
jgi:hypothetical protein